MSWRVLKSALAFKNALTLHFPLLLNYVAMVELIKDTTLCACAFVYVYRHTIHLSYLAGLLFIVINFLETSQMLQREGIPALSSSADYLLNSWIKTMFFCVMNWVEGTLLSRASATAKSSGKVPLDS